MQSRPPLSELVERTLQEIGKLGLCAELPRQYRRIYERLKRFAGGRKEECYSVELIRSFLAETEQRYRRGVIGRSRRNHLRRAALLLEECHENGRIDWRVYCKARRVMPSSKALLRLYAQYLDSLKAKGRSEDTLGSARNLVCQFLVFLEEAGYRSLSEAPLRIVPSFFRHLLSRYRPNSMRIAVWQIRSFLGFVEDGKRFLPLVPSRCLRERPIIPVLSEKEYEALKRALDGPTIPVRDKAILRLALRTGLRSVDIVRLKLSDIDWVRETISLVQSKTGRAVTIPLTADVGNALSAYILGERPKVQSPHVFLRSQAPHRALGGHSACYAVVRAAFACAGIRGERERKGLHLIRHSTASRMLSAGVPVTTIASVLGHAKKSSTEVYLSTDESRMRDCTLPLSEVPMPWGGVR